MATNTNDVLGNAGTMGEFTIYTRKGVTIVRKKHNLRSKKGRTTASMSQRTKIGNLVAVWRSLGGELKDCFELRKRGASDYNGFMSANGRSSRVYLPKELSERKASVADSYTIASGQMQPSIQVERRGERMVSDIRVGRLVLTRHTTVNELSGALVSNNFGNILYGDRILFVRMTQYDNPQMELPYVLSSVGSFQLERDSFRPVAQVVYDEEGTDGFEVTDGCLSAAAERNSYVAWIHTRRDRDGVLHVATQKLVGENDILERYTSWEARERAIKSYGPVKQTDPMQMPSYEQAAYMQYLESQGQWPACRQGSAEVEITAQAMPAEGGTVEGGGLLPAGSGCTLTAHPAAGWRFKCWDDGLADPTLNLRPKHSDHRIAFFEKCEKN